ncbi:uncharacterized protein G2W53_025020 [Senna tora]|uniref:Uncharacterized protein n=1 Tax=Senna tora TaxID=362788 RepID=A0A834TEE5_9FABA|nr:uncharacterized protein G2W53_025020 [Senna tora]
MAEAQDVPLPSPSPPFVCISVGC